MKRRHSTLFPGVRRYLTCLLLATATITGCSSPDCRSSATPARPNVVLITIDTMRADHLSADPGRSTRTPAIDRLAEEGVTFETCYAQSNVTVPSHLSILTSLPVTDHGVLGNGRPLPGAVLTLPEILAAAGYRTAAIVSAKHLGPEFAVGAALKGLDHYHAPRRLSEPASAEETNRTLFRWMRSTCAEPFFAWVHYWDPHMPYTPPAPFDRMYYDGDPYDERHTSMERVTQAWHHYERRSLGSVLGSRRDELLALQDEIGTDRPTLRKLLLERRDLAPYVDDPSQIAQLRARLDALVAIVRANLPLQPGLASWLTGVRDIEFPRAQYAGEVSYVDQAIGALRAELERLGIADRTILVLTGDHGESLGEHGIYFGHAGLYETTLRVPLTIWAPGRAAAARHPEPVSSLDIAPTILHLVGVPVPPTLQGRDLLLGEPGDGRILFSVANHGRQIMVREGRWKLIRTLESFYYADDFAPRAGDLELYDIVEDPDELVNLTRRRPEVAARLDSRLEQWMKERWPGERAEHPAELSPEQREGLRALGYVE